MTEQVFKIRHRWVVYRTPAGRHESLEYQVVQGRKVVGRFDHEDEAKQWIAKLDGATVR